MSILEERRATRCPKECGFTFSTPHTVCPKCDPVESRAEIDRWGQQAEHAYPVDSAGYGCSLLAWLGGDRFIRVHDAEIFLRLGRHTTTDKLIADAQRLTDENRELLIENARFRRALDRPPVDGRNEKGGVLGHTCINTATTTDGSVPPPCPACRWRSTGKLPAE